MMNKKQLIEKFNPKTIYSYNGELYFCLDDRSENLFKSDGSILGKAYQPECAEIIAKSIIIYPEFDND